MTGDRSLRWRTDHPARVRAQLGDVGLAPTGGGRFGCRGLRIAVERGAGERLVELERGDRAEAPPGRAHATVDAPELLAVGFATVDLERAAAALGGLVALLRDDDLLGARVARVRDAGDLVLEPSREGRLAATLARSGEGPAVLYLGFGTAPLAAAVARLRTRGTPAVAGTGPLGPQRLVRVDPPWAPHLVLVAVPDQP